MKDRPHNRLLKNGKTPPLRDWQARCIETALQVLNDDSPHFLCQATPGAGKMLMSAVLAEELILNGSIDWVLYLGPTSTIVQQARQQFERVLERPLRGQASDAGTCVTYQALHHRLDTLKQLCRRRRVLMIWDESHHAASQTSVDGTHVSGLNQWGNALLSLERHVRFTLALSGTPWRTDGSCLPLLHYQAHEAASSSSTAHLPDRRLIPGFVYSLREAIDDQVCRIPTIHMLDNREILLQTQATSAQSSVTKRYTSLPALLRHPQVPYASLVRHDGLVTQLLHHATDQLIWWRQEDPTAAGLVIAADIAHASIIAERLDQQGHTTCLVHSQLPGAHESLARFQQSGVQWIISVNMISEGVDLPRLRVCCYLSRIKTEQYFRQALGRIIRRQNHFDAQCDIFMLQDPLLERYAQRVLEDLPEPHSRIQYSSFAGNTARALPDARPLRQGALPERQTQDVARLPPHRRPPGTLTDAMIARLEADTSVSHSARDLIAEIHFSREYLTHVIRPT